MFGVTIISERTLKLSLESPLGCEVFVCPKHFSLKMRAVGSSSAWTKGDRKARRQLEKSLKSDESDDVTRFALVRLLANKADPVAAEVRHMIIV